jgi:methylmalonyl-CoA/ethylmalonyl-CoA epimerase
VYLNNTNIELLEPLGEKSPIENFLKKKPEGGIHHVCLEVSNVSFTRTNIITSHNNIEVIHVK